MEGMKEQLSEHFTMWELTRSGTAISRGIANEPTEADCNNMRALCRAVLEPLRRRFGRISITSGYRSAALNEAVGGAPTSQHMRGEAVDIFVGDGELGQRYFDFLRAHTDFDQLIWEPMGAPVARWLHVSYTQWRPNRHEVMGKQRARHTTKS